MRGSRELRILLFCFLFLLIAIIIACNINQYKINADSERFFKHGMEFYNEQNYQDAYYNFNQIKKSADLYSLALLKQFQCANKLHDKQTALIKLDALQNRKISNLIRPYILYNELKYNELTMKYSKMQAYKKYLYIYSNYPESDFAYASTFAMGKLLLKKDPRQSKIYLVEYLKYAPNGKYAIESLDILKELEAYIIKDDYKIIGEAYLKNLKYKEANAIFKIADFNSNWYNLALSYKGLGDKTQEQEVILKGLYLDTTSVDEKNIALAIDRLIKMNNFDKIQTLQDMYSKYQNKSSYPTIIYKLAESLTSIRSLKLYEYLIENYPNSIWASNSIWEAFWYNYQQGRFKLCNELAAKHENLYPKTKDAPRLLYWHGRVLLKEKRTSEAKEKFSKVLRDYPISYYAFLSARQMKLSKANKLINKKTIQSYDIDLLSKALFKDDKSISLLLEYNDYETIDELKINDEYIKSWIQNKKGNYPESIRLATDALNSEEDLKLDYSDYRLKLMYPIKYEDIINSNAQTYKISPYLFMSLVREESHFNKNAKSPVGALGLSQVMPSTANHIEKMTVSKQTLLDPNENIRIGQKYFDYVIRHFDGNLYLAILSYNAGFGNVDKWLRSPETASSEIDVFVENVPFGETKNYIKKILSTYWAYQNIYTVKNRLI